MTPEKGYRAELVNQLVFMKHELHILLLRVGFEIDSKELEQKLEAVHLPVFGRGCAHGIWEINKGKICPELTWVSSFVFRE